METAGRDIRAALASGLVIGDGAMGTQLHAAGLGPGDCAEEWNSSHPEVVRQVAKAYADAGSMVVSTNTFGASPAKLSDSGLADKCEELNAAAVRLAREGAKPGVFVAGDVGPSGLILEPYGDTPRAEAVDGFVRQARGLVTGGADCILIETMIDLAEALAAVEAVREVSSTLPVFCTMSFQPEGRTTFGTSVAQAAEALGEVGVDGVGLNCGTGSPQAVGLAEQFIAATDLPVIIQPNAGVPRLVDGRTVFDETPQDMADSARKYRDLGVRWIGGCCGSTPDHIRAIAEALQV